MNIMLDLETLGTHVGCQVVSIGAVIFDARGLGETFYQVLDLEEQAARGLEAEPQTLHWWARQSARVRSELEHARHGALPVSAVLKLFNDYVLSAGSDVKVWGNGAAFDNAIIRHLYRVFDLEPVWGFRNDRCFRTLKDCPVPPPELRGEPHVAVDDAIAQAQHAVLILNSRKWN